MLEGPQHGGACEGVIADQNQAPFLGQGRQRGNRHHLHGGIGDGLEVQHLRFGPEGGAHRRRIGHVHEGGFDAEIRRPVGQELVGRAVGRPVANKVIALLQQPEERGGHRGHARGRGEHRIGTLHAGEVVLEEALPGIAAAPVNIHRLPSPGHHLLIDCLVVLKTRGDMNGRGDGAGGGIGRLVNGCAGQGPRGCGVGHGTSFRFFSLCPEPAPTPTRAPGGARSDALHCGEPSTGGEGPWGQQ